MAVVTMSGERTVRHVGDVFVVPVRYSVAAKSYTCTALQQYHFQSFVLVDLVASVAIYAYY